MAQYTLDAKSNFGGSRRVQHSPCPGLFISLYLWWVLLPGRQHELHYVSNITDLVELQQLMRCVLLVILYDLVQGEGYVSQISV